MALHCRYNRTRLWRYTGGTEWTTKMPAHLPRCYSAARNTISKLFRPPQPASRANFSLASTSRRATIGGSVQWTKALRPWLMLIAGTNGDDVRASDDETRSRMVCPMDWRIPRRASAILENMWKRCCKPRTGPSPPPCAETTSSIWIRCSSCKPEPGPSPRQIFPTGIEALANPRLGMVRRLDRLCLAHRLGLSCLSLSHHERALPAKPGSARRSTLPNPNLVGARHRIGNTVSSFFTHAKHRGSRQLFLDRSESSGNGSDDQRDSHANCQAARKPGTNSQPRPLVRLRIAASLPGFPSPADIDTRMRPSPDLFRSPPGRQMDSSGRAQHGHRAGQRHQAEDRACRIAGNTEWATIR